MRAIVLMTVLVALTPATLVNRGNERRNQNAAWMPRRAILHGTTVVSLLAKQPLKNYEAPVPDAITKQTTAVFASLKFQAAAKR